MHVPREAGPARARTIARVHPLLDPPAPTSRAALAAVQRWLAHRIRRWRVARLLLGRRLASDLGVPLAWHLLVRELLRPGQEELALQRAREELLATLRDAERGAGRSPLGVALGRRSARFKAAALALRAHVEALERDAHVSVHASRTELRALRARTAHAEARSLLLVLERAGILGETTWIARWVRPERTATEVARARERAEVQALALADGIDRAVALTHARAWLSERGRLTFAAEDLAEAGVTPAALSGGAVDAAALTRLVEPSVREAHADLAKGWPLCRALGPWRGRQLAFVLRWHAAALQAVRHAAARGRLEPSRGGFTRLVSCAAVAGITRAPASGR